MSVGTGQDPFLTVAEIAAMTRLSTMTVYRLIHDGDLEAHRFGRGFRIRRSALVAWLEQTPWRPARRNAAQR
jgi:excisionase family DNA binding protein